MSEQKQRIKGAIDSAGKLHDLRQKAELEAEKIAVRAELQSADFDVDTAVVESTAAERVKKHEETRSDPPPRGPIAYVFTPVVYLVKLVPSAWRVWPVLLIIAMAGAGLLRYLGLF